MVSSQQSIMRALEGFEETAIRDSGDTGSARSNILMSSIIQPGFLLKEAPEEYRKIISLSEESKKIVSYLSLPEQDRKPVGYNREYHNLILIYSLFECRVKWGKKIGSF